MPKSWVARISRDVSSGRQPVTRKKRIRMGAGRVASQNSWRTCAALSRQCVRAAKEMDSKSIGLCPQGFESPRCRIVNNGCAGSTHATSTVMVHRCFATMSTATDHRMVKLFPRRTAQRGFETRRAWASPTTTKHPTRRHPRIHSTTDDPTRRHSPYKYIVREHVTKTVCPSG